MRNADVYLVDGTYELFRHFYAVPPASAAAGTEVGAVRGVLGSLLRMIEQGATHLGVATDHVIESFRNALWPGYKTGEGVQPELLAQFAPLERALAAMGVAVWPMVELEADDALASAAAICERDAAVGRVIICTPDKDLAQCVRDGLVVQLDRRSGRVRDEAGVVERFGVLPASIPDYLALVGDSADDFPGLPGFGAKTAAALLARYGHLEAIPADGAAWDVPVRGAAKLAQTLTEQHERARLFRDLATLRTAEPLFESVEQLRWRGPRPQFAALSRALGAPGLHERAVAAARSA
ncbi:MAG: flap endonuclease [Dehalococcoidia bacterium]|nr:flap endonuclease [Dehalococcoidia bacterium]